MMNLATRLPSAASPAALGPIDFANVLRAMITELESQHERTTKSASWQPVEVHDLAKELHGLAERADAVAEEKEKAGTAVVPVVKSELDEALITAAEKGDLAEVQALLAKGADVKAVGERSGGWTPLHRAAANHR